MSIAKAVICVHKRYSPAVLFLVLLFLISFPLNSSAALIRTSSGHNAGYLSWKNPETGYAAYLDDTCDLLTAEEEQALLEDMKPISEYCNVTFFSGDDGYGTAMQYAEETYRVYMNYDSGVLLMVDMYNRELTIYTDGEAYKVITPAKCRSITDNIYRYAVNGEFYSCASEAFAQSYLLLSGSRIAEPMKYISNLLIALCLAFLLTYLFVSTRSRAMKPTREELLRSIGASFRLQNPRAQAGKTTRIHSPRVIVSGGSGSRGGGGGHSGGGGGHSF